MFMYEYARAGDLSSHYTPHYKLSAAIHARNYIGNLRPAFNNGSTRGVAWSLSPWSSFLLGVRRHLVVTSFAISLSAHACKFHDRWPGIFPSSPLLFFPPSYFLRHISIDPGKIRESPDTLAD